MKRKLGAAGAAGDLLKDATPEDLGQAVNVAISGGGSVLSSGVIQNLFDDVKSSGDTLANGNGRPRRTEFNLTHREHDILALLAEGRSNRSIAQNLYLSEKTVKAHLAAIFRKLGVINRTQAALIAVQLGVGPVPGAVVALGESTAPQSRMIGHVRVRVIPSTA